MRMLIREAKTAYSHALNGTMTAAAQAFDCALEASSILGRRDLTQLDFDEALVLLNQASSIDTGGAPTVSKFGRFRAEVESLSMEAQQRTVRLALESSEQYALVVPHLLHNRRGEPLCGARAVALEDDRYEVVCNATGAQMGITYLGDGGLLAAAAVELRRRAGL